MGPLTSPALAAIHAVLSSSNTGEGSTRTAEFIACTRRIISRLRADTDLIPALDAERREEWGRLVTRATNGNVTTGTVHEAAEAIQRQTAQGTDTGDGVLNAPWFADTARALNDYIEALETGLPAPAAANQAAGSNPNDIRDRLSRYLRARFPELPADPIIAMEIIPGGRAKETARFRLVPNASMPSRLILRRDFDRDTTGTRSATEYPLLNAVHAAGIPVPRPILAENDSSVLGGTFMIVEEVENSSSLGELFPELNDFSRVDPTFNSALGQSLATLHRINQPVLVEQMGGHHMATTPHAAVRGFYDLWKSVPAPPFSLATEMGFAWLIGTALPDDRPHGLVHGDLGAHNFMMRDGRLVAILDWELAHMGDPAEDLGYLRATIIEQLGGWDIFAEGYLGAGGDSRACDMRAVDWFSIWAHVRNSVYVALFHDWVATGERTDIESVNAGWDFFARTQRYIARELNRALSR